MIFDYVQPINYGNVRVQGSDVKCARDYLECFYNKCGTRIKHS